jgi:hypothetical protein
VKRIPAAILSAELIRRRRQEMVDLAKGILGDPAEFARFVRSLSDRDLERLASEQVQLLEVASGGAEEG